MRVCMLAYTFYEGDNRVMRYAEALAERGDEVEVIALRKPGQSKEEVLHGVKVLRIQERIKNERSQLTYFLRIVAFLLRAMVVLSVRHLRAPYRVVHVHSIPDFLVFAAWLPKVLRAGVILDIHDLSPELYTIKFGEVGRPLVFRTLCWVERLSASFADHVIVPNHLWRARLIARSVSDGRCSVFMNLPDPTIFQRRGRSQSADGRVVLLYPGSLQWHQGLDIAIRAMERIQATNRRVELHIYGEGQAKPSLLQLVEERGLQACVFFHPALPLREIVRVMEDADLGIVPKRNDSFGNEAFSTKVLEFMALGVPVVVADTMVDRHYFSEDVVSFFRAGSDEDMARVLGALIGSPERRARQQRAAQQLVDASFNWRLKKLEYLALADRLGAERVRRSADTTVAEKRAVEINR